MFQIRRMLGYEDSQGQFCARCWGLDVRRKRIGIDYGCFGGV